MPKEFTVPPVVFPATAMASGNLQQRRFPLALSIIPFFPLIIGSAHASASASPPPSEPESGFFEELENSLPLIWRKTLTIFNPFSIDPVPHAIPDLTGAFIYNLIFTGVQFLTARKFPFGVIWGWTIIASLPLYWILNLLSEKKGNWGRLHRCASVVGYSMIPITLFSAVSWLFLPPSGWSRFAVCSVFVAWATRVCSRLMVTEFGDQCWVITYPCLLLYAMFSLLTLF